MTTAVATRKGYQIEVYEWRKSHRSGGDVLVTTQLHIDEDGDFTLKLEPNLDPLNAKDSLRGKFKQAGWNDLFFSNCWSNSYAICCGWGQNKFEQFPAFPCSDL